MGLRAEAGQARNALQTVMPIAEPARQAVPAPSLVGAGHHGDENDGSSDIQVIFSAYRTENTSEDHPYNAESDVYQYSRFMGA
jgi:hypothetical protein